MDSRQALIFDADRDSQHGDDSESSSDTFEMSGLEEVPVTPRRIDYGTSPYRSNSMDLDDDSDIEDAGDQALLGPHSRTRGRERTVEHATDLFSQVKRIVLEVRRSAYVHCGVDPSIMLLDCSNAAVDNRRSTLDR